MFVCGCDQAFSQNGIKHPVDVPVLKKFMKDAPTLLKFCSETCLQAATFQYLAKSQAGTLTESPLKSRDNLEEVPL